MTAAPRAALGNAFADPRRPGLTRIGQHRVIRACVALGLTVIATTGIGCSRPGPPRQVVHGRVTFAGRPVPAGLIRFEPSLALGNHAPMGLATIRDGRYRTAPDRSPVRGAYVARLVGGDGVAPAVSPAASADPDAERLRAAAAAARPLGTEWFRDHVVEVEITGNGRPFDIDVPR